MIRERKKDRCSIVKRRIDLMVQCRSSSVVHDLRASPSISDSPGVLKTVGSLICWRSLGNGDADIESSCTVLDCEWLSGISRAARND